MPPPEPPPLQPGEIRLYVTLAPNGEVYFFGPINQAVLCYGMLTAAITAVQNYTANLKSKLEIASHLPPGGKPS
jgi:hypothetical protein